MKFPRKELPPIQEKLIEIKNSSYKGITHGTAAKPDACGSCILCNKGTGFVPDRAGNPDSRIGLLLDAPKNDDVIHRAPLSGYSGNSRYYHLLGRLGFKVEDTPIFHLLRCKNYPYPVGTWKDGAEKSCRTHDSLLTEFNHSITMITFDPSELFSVPAYTRQLHRDMEKAVKLSEHGKVLVAVGDNAAKHVASFIEGRGGLKAWHGHYFLRS